MNAKRNKIWLLFLAIWLGLAGVVPLPSTMAANEGTSFYFAAGSGTEDDPYIIEMPEQLYALSEHQHDNQDAYLSAHFQLAEEINFTDGDWTTNPWEPIGTDGAPFTGTFDGNGYVIRNLKVDKTENFVGMFGVIGTDGIVRNVTLQNADITGINIVGTLAGQNYGKVKASSASGHVIGKNGVGGLVGSNRGRVEASYATGRVSGEVQVGGLVGYNSGTIQTSYVTGDADGSYIVGGLVGDNERGTVQDSYATGRVSGSNSVGGLAGHNSGTIQTSYATGEVTGSQQVGGLVGNNGNTVQTSYWNRDVVSEGIGSGSGDATGLTEEQMQDKSNFTVFDFAATWAIKDGGIPYLKPVVIGIVETAPVTVPFGTPFEQIPLPGQLNIKLSDGEILQDVDVEWDAADNPGYDPNTARAYIMTGTLKLDDVEAVASHSDETVTVKVIVKQDQSCETGRTYVKANGGDDTNDGCSWDTAFATLQQALDATDTSNGDTYEIWMAKGTYVPTGNKIGDDPRTVHFKMKNGVAIYGGFAGNEEPETFDLALRDFVANETILSGKIGLGDDDSDHAYHVFYHDGGVDETAILDGVTITGGRANGTDFDNNGGSGMYNRESHPALTNVTISGNMSNSSGGGMYNDSSNPALTNMTISGNTSNYGGGIYNVSSSPSLTKVTINGNKASAAGGGMYNTRSSPVLTNVAIRENTSSSGGGIASAFSSPSLTKVTINGNKASGAGGGMYNTRSSPVLTNVVIRENTSSSYGGGISSVSSSPSLTNVTISGNKSDSFGAGVYNRTGSMTLLNVIISGNAADIGGGGMLNSDSSPILTNVIISGNLAKYQEGGGIINVSGSSPTLTNVTISGNTAKTKGGAIYNQGSSKFLIRNSLIWGNGLDNGEENNISNDNPSDSNVVFSLIGDPLAEGPDGVDLDTITIDTLLKTPMSFGDAPTTEGDYRLKQGSPAINGGNNDLVPHGVATDRDGNPRIVGGRVDLGAYEYQDNDEETPVPTQVEIAGAGTIVIPASDKAPITEQYRADVLDENGDVMPNEKVQWSVTASEGVSIDLEKGLLTITDQASAGPIMVKATLDGDAAIFGEFGVTLQVSAVKEPVPSDIDIRGAKEIILPASGEPPITKQYEADVLDEDGDAMPNEKVQWSIIATEGVSIDSETGLLTVTDQASAGPIMVKATLDGDAAIFSEFGVTLQASAVKEPVPSDIDIRGATEITIPTSGEPPVTKQYEADVLDEDGNVMPNEKVQWSVTATEGVSIDSETGLLTITDQVSVGPITVKATLESDATISGEINVTLRAGSEEPPDPDTEAPQWREGDELTVSDITQTSVKLSWPEATDHIGVTGYRIYVEDKVRKTVSGSVYGITVLDLEADTEYTFKVTAYDEAGSESAPLTAAAKTLPERSEPVGEAPQWPENSELTVSNITQTSVKLSWPSATDQVGVTGYRIYIDDDNWQPQTVSGNVREYTIQNLRTGTTYTFSVKAYNEAEKESAPLSKQATTARSSGGDGGSGSSGGGGGGYVLSNNADLADLQVWTNEKKLKLSPSFSSGMTEYIAHTEAEQIEIVVKEAHSAAKVIWKDKVITDRIKDDLKEGKNTYVLTVQAENGTKKKYTLTVYRETLQPSEPLIEFTDIAGYWAENYIRSAAAKGIVSGYPDGTFKPNNPVTRAEFTVMLAGNLKLEGQGAALAFTDNDQIGRWAKQAVAQAVEAGIIDGYNDGSFRPNNRITRVEMAAMIARVLKQQLNTNVTTGFADDEAIPEWAKGAVEAIRKLGIVDGRGGNRFAANETATRAEATMMLLRMLEHK
ncbi:S-layer homology domain-containing protein [Paenibacillus sp. J2TS4]|uniref:S-layer homology domain-containing protein n=1 Tax=Paenibacillus sp. J2TS4 TaxID=2807194 RepID=UPI001B09738A|nr:S-layer homology domain-containing protein [Paenibacillus sp. J2TS4]GIP30807.1 hypothetical protein J2TS4_00170 [Paenibacillus sp. J2TS4]